MYGVGGVSLILTSLKRKKKLRQKAKIGLDTASNGHISVNKNNNGLFPVPFVAPHLYGVKHYICKALNHMVVYFVFKTLYTQKRMHCCFKGLT